MKHKKKHPHHGHKASALPPAPAAPMPGAHEFDAGQERAMRQAGAAARAPMPGSGEPDADDMGM